MAFDFWRRYLDGIPEYLARHYWWAYLSPRGVWFFDHAPIINLILFGQYRAILNEVMHRYATRESPRTLQLTCAYGALTPTLALSANTRELHVTDVAGIQLSSAESKLQAISRSAKLARMNAESLAYASDSFDSVIIFFLLHELPGAARERTLNEAIRVLKPGGHLLIAEYGENRGIHWLHRCTPWRGFQEKIEPFLRDFWHSNLAEQIAGHAIRQGKPLQAMAEVSLFDGFYRVLEYRV
ncbi:MAG: class I SAM-dependent methyltransferase [Gallionellaceae bacterium]|nr:MAG: class I SAM-dependent methyltransferase [Gallionellaceae bacterium]